MHHFSTTM